MLKEYVLKYRTEKDLEDARALDEQRKPTWQKYAGALSEWADNVESYRDANKRAAMQAAQAEWFAFGDQMEAIWKRAETRYVDHFKEDYPEEAERRAAIFTDIKEKVRALDETEKADFEAEIVLALDNAREGLKEDPDNEIWKEEAEDTDNAPRYWLMAEFMGFLLTFQTDALKAYNYYDEGAAADIAAIIADKAKEWGAEVPEVLTVDEILNNRLRNRRFGLAWINRDKYQESIEKKYVSTFYEKVAVRELYEEEDRKNAGAPLRPATLPQLKAIQAAALEYPLDKIDRTLWRLGEEDLGGQLRFAFEKHGTKREINALVSINFDDLAAAGIKFTRQLTQFDKRVYIATGALYNSSLDNGITTARQIYYAMGNYRKAPNGKEKNPSSADIEKINQSLTKLAGTRLTLDNSEEVKAGYNYSKFIYDGALLPMERVTRQNVNGKIIESAIHMFREPPLLSFAKGRKQFTTIPRGLLEVGISNTEDKLAIEDYLIERISRADTATFTIRLDTLYQEIKLTGYKQRQRAPEKIKAILDHYKAQKFIKGFRITKDKIDIVKHE